MPEQTLSGALEQVLTQLDEPGTSLAALLPLLGQALKCDRCFLYLRHPATKFGKVPFCWRRDSRFPLVQDSDWKPEPASLAQEDPLFAAALRTAPSVYVEDVQTASPDQVNPTFEQENFGHRALIHAHLCQDGQLWGVLQPCVFDHPRTWSEADRTLMAQVEQQVTPLAIAYVKANYP